MRPAPFQGEKESLESVHMWLLKNERQVWQVCMMLAHVAVSQSVPAVLNLSSSQGILGGVGGW